jgi:K(+)-stimulated pyrophosphate-energized sodium pump
MPSTAVILFVFFSAIGNDPHCLGHARQCIPAAGLVSRRRYYRIAASVVVVFVTQYYTEGRYRPVKTIVDASKTAPLPIWLPVSAVGFESTFLTAYHYRRLTACLLLHGFSGSEGLGLNAMAAGAFGTAIATMVC